MATVANKKIISRVAILLLVLSFIFIMPLSTLAQDNSGEYTPLAPIPGIPQPESSPGSVDFTGYVTGWVQILIGVAGVLAVIAIIIGGIQYITAGDSESNTSDAKERIWKALIGLILAQGVKSWAQLPPWVPTQTSDPGCEDEAIAVLDCPGSHRPHTRCRCR